MTYSAPYYFKVDESIAGTHNLLISDQKVDGSYNEMRPVLIGVTKGVVVNSKLYSKSGSVPLVSQTATVFHEKATALGAGFDIIDYETHCKLAHLFYAAYGNRNPQAMSQFGTGSSNTGRTSGETAVLGNADGKTANQVAFHGVEDPYGNVYEYMGGITGNGRIYYIYDGFAPDRVPTSSYRVITVPPDSDSTASGWVSKLTWGTYGDMIPKEFLGSETTHFCDYCYLSNQGWRVVMRSRDAAGGGCGFATFDGRSDSGISSIDIGSRIQYRGNIQVIDSPAEFIALPTGF